MITTLCDPLSNSEQSLMNQILFWAERGYTAHSVSVSPTDKEQTERELTSLGFTVTCEKHKDILGNDCLFVSWLNPVESEQDSSNTAESVRALCSVSKQLETVRNMITSTLEMHERTLVYRSDMLFDESLSLPFL